MTTAQIDHNAEKSNSYKVRRQLPGHVEGQDWSAHMADRVVVAVALRDDIMKGIKAGDRFRLFSTTNAGFRGIEGTARNGRTFQNLGTLGAYSIEVI